MFDQNGIRKTSKLDYKIVNRDGRKTITCFSGWNSELTKIALDAQVMSIEYHPFRADPKTVDLGFLSQFPHLTGFAVSTTSNDPVDSFELIYSLKQLESLRCGLFWNSEIDFSLFPNLNAIEFQWHPNKSLSKCSGLKSLIMHDFLDSDLIELKELQCLEKLYLFCSKIRNLNGLQFFKDLKLLRISVCGRLESLEGIETLSNLEELWLVGSRKISSLEGLKNNLELRKLIIENLGDIESLSPLKNLLKLEMVIFLGSTNIVDGDLSVLNDLPLLKNVGFKNRKHYSHTRDYFEEKYK